MPEQGYGWICELTSPCAAVEMPAPFHMVVERFFRVGGTLTGGSGTIREPGHPLDGLRLAFATREAATADFTLHPARCNLTVGCRVAAAADGWLTAGGPPALVGCGVLRDDES